MLFQANPEFVWSSMLYQQWSFWQTSCHQVQVSIIYRQDMCHLDVLSNHIGKWNTLHPRFELEVEQYSLHSFYPVNVVYFGHFNLVCLIWYSSTFLLLTWWMSYSLEWCFIILNMNKASLRFFATIWIPHAWHPLTECHQAFKWWHNLQWCHHQID